MKCEDCHGTGWQPTAAGVGVTNFSPCGACGGSGITSCCDGAVGGAADVPGETRYLTAGEQQTLRRALRASTRVIAVGEILTTDRELSDAEVSALKAQWEKLSTGNDTVLLRLTAEQRDVLRQELYHNAHKLDAQARTTNPRSTRHKALTERAALLRSVAGQLA